MTITIDPPTTFIETYNASFYPINVEYVDRYTKNIDYPEAGFIIRSGIAPATYTLTIEYRDDNKDNDMSTW